MANPYLKFALKSIHYDSAGFAVVHDQPYLLEWLRRNYAFNGGFEEWGGADPDNWTNYGCTKSAGAYEGANCIKGLVGDSMVSSVFLPINPKLQYRFSCYAKSDSPALYGANFAISLQFYDSDQNGLGAPVLYGTDTTNTWTKFTVLYSLSDYPAGTAYAKIILDFFDAAVKYSFLDAISLTPYNPHDLEDFSDFALLQQDDYETYTFTSGVLLKDTKFHEMDDPTIYTRSESGKLRMERKRYPLRSMVLNARIHSYEAMFQLRRFFAKTRGFPFFYVDKDGIEYEVVWRGKFRDPGAKVSTDRYKVKIPLEFLSVTEGD